jgi:DNA-binding phage protein
LIPCRLGRLQMHILEVEDVVRLLRSEVKRAGGQAAWASKTGLNRIVVNKVLNGKTLPTKKIIKALKLRVVYVSGLDVKTRPTTTPG